MNVNERAIPVSAALRPWISEISLASLGGHTGEQTVLDAPDHATTLTVRAVPGLGSELVVMGPRTRALYHVGQPGPFCVNFRLRPGGARLLLGRSVREFVDRAVGLSGLWGVPGGHLASELAELLSDPAVITAPAVARRLGEALLAGLAPRHLGGLPPRELVGDAATLLSVGAHAQPERVAMTARRLHVSERHLRNLFTEAVGVSPKQFARIDQVRTVLASVRHRHLAQLATEAGYYDQSHMTAEFRRLMGVSPGAFAAGALPAASWCGRP